MGLCLGLVLLIAPVFAGQPVDELATATHAEIRAAERAVYCGQDAKAASLLEHARVMLEQLERAGPGPAALQDLKDSYDRARTLVDRSPVESPAPDDRAPKNATGPQ